MTKKVPKKILRIERNFFVNLGKMFLAAHAAPLPPPIFWTGGAPPPPTEIDRRAAADTMTSAHSSRSGSCGQGRGVSKTRFSCGRHKWMTPLDNILMFLYYIIFLEIS